MKTLFKKIKFLPFIFICFHTVGQLNWVIESPDGKEETIKLGDKATGGKYLLKNSTVEFTDAKYRHVLSAILKHGDRGVGGGVNLVWGSMTEKFNGSNYVNIERKPGFTGPLKTGEPVALRFENGGYLSYGSSTVGVDLQFKYGSESIKTVVPYQFAFYEGTGDPGIIVKTNELYALKNTSKGDYLFYCNRGYGINLDWLDSCEDGKMSILNELNNKLSLAESVAKKGKRLYKIVRD